MRLADCPQVRRSGRPSPAAGPPPIEPLGLQQALFDAFTAGNGISPAEQLCEDWYDLARQYGITVPDEQGDLRPEVDDAITRTVTAAIWFGVTTGYLTLTDLPHPPASSTTATWTRWVNGTSGGCSGLQAGEEAGHLAIIVPLSLFCR